MWQGCLKACTKCQLGADEPGQPKGLELYMNGSYRSLEGLTTPWAAASWGKQRPLNRAYHARPNLIPPR